MRKLLVFEHFFRGFPNQNVLIVCFSFCFNCLCLFGTGGIWSAVDPIPPLSPSRSPTVSLAHSWKTWGGKLSKIASKSREIPVFIITSSPHFPSKPVSFLQYTLVRLSIKIKLSQFVSVLEPPINRSFNEIPICFLSHPNPIGGFPSCPTFRRIVRDLTAMHLLASGLFNVGCLWEKFSSSKK